MSRDARRPGRNKSQPAWAQASSSSSRIGRGRLMKTGRLNQPKKSSFAFPPFQRILLIHLQHRQKCILRNLYAADFLHPLLAFFLFLQELALARDVAAVAL